MNKSSEFKLSDPHFEATIFYLPSEEGGRSTEVRSGYRGQFYYGGKNWDAGQQFIDKIVCEPGSSVNVIMQTATPNNHKGRLFVNKRFEIKEGARVVGIGRITNLVLREFQRTDFNNWDKKIIELILRQNEFGIVSVNDLDDVKSLEFKSENYLSISKLVKEGKWYAIEEDEFSGNKGTFHEFLYIEMFSDDQGKEYIVTVYDNDELWQDPEIIEIIPMS